MTEKTAPAGRLRRATIAFAVYSGVMMEIERRLHRTGGVGIIAFELAGNEKQASEMMTQWGVRGQRWARTSLWLDFGYMLTYGALTALLVDRARHRQGHSSVVLMPVLGAVAGDAIEGISLLKVLDGSRIGIHARRARIAALGKFACLAVSLAYAAAGNAMPENAARP